MAHYRDKRTGRFAKKSTWKRSKALDGTRYIRESERKKKGGKYASGTRQQKVARKAKKAAPVHEAVTPNKMWRVVVAAPYYKRTGKKKSEYKSAAFMVRGWFATRDEARASLDKLKRQAKRGRKRFIASPRNRAWESHAAINTEISQVDFDKRFLDIIEEENEK